MSRPPSPATVSEPSVRETLRRATDALVTAGVASPRVDAELLLAHVTGRSRSRLVLLDRLTPAEAELYRQLIDRRSGGEPLQHLTGTAAFRYLELAVGPGVFVPRPETELLLELAANRLIGRPTVVDLCAGSGAIALSVAHEHPGASVFAVERSPRALDWLLRNAESRTMAGDPTITVVAADVTDPLLLTDLTASVDVVLSNPPYVPARSRAELGVEVGHDPDEAVFAGDDGLALLPGLLATAARLLRPGGFVAIEHDESHGRSLPALMTATGAWGEVTDHRDLTGRPRFVTAVRA